MDIAISEQNQERIRRKVESGMYSSADDVLADALTLLDERDDDLESELADMRRKVRKGLDESKAGLAVPASEVFDELRRRNAEFVSGKR
jgi:antitoxin ParD1/3/4